MSCLSSAADWLAAGPCAYCVAAWLLPLLVLLLPAAAAAAGLALAFFLAAISISKEAKTMKLPNRFPTLSPPPAEGVGSMLPRLVGPVPMLPRLLFRTAAIGACLLYAVRQAWLARQRAMRRLLFRARPPCNFVQSMLDKTKKPAGMSFVDFMYDCFKRDVAVGEVSNSDVSSSHVNYAGGRGTLRVMTFNVHFFQQGFSGKCFGDSMDDVMSILKRVNPDVLMLQEVPPSLLEPLRARLKATCGLSFSNVIAAGSADVHILDPAVGVYPNERLHVVLASRVPFARCAAVPMLDGNAAFAELCLDAAGKRTALLYCLHLSVRCEASKRRDEVAAVLEHAKALGGGGGGGDGSGRLTLIAGDFNQPNASDYPEAEWAAIADDMTRAKLDLDDGAMACLRAAGFVPTFEAAKNPRPLPTTTAWNGALVDYIYTNNQPRRHHVEVDATYVYHTLASDHLPLVCDLVVSE